ncbi:MULTISPECIES: hypothetical protein [Niastella]|uniref:Uncharacterized protein n=1 Tax=Niastella soli TaxID=2821487 RepID=A0ABS3YZ51_9BACT|nr:hypothetical protein [Niastella soli]MBO9203209.1 hypothetical protein [Niastella soli]
MKVYVTDDGHYMERDDLMQYLRLLKDTTMVDLSKEQFVKRIWDNNYFGDSIINQECFLKMKQEF